MHFQRKNKLHKGGDNLTFTNQLRNKKKMVSVFKVIVFAANISAHVLTLGPEKDQALFDNYLSPMQVRIDLTVQFHQ